MYKQKTYVGKLANFWDVKLKKTQGPHVKVNSSNNTKH